MKIVCHSALILTLTWLNLAWVKPYRLDDKKPAEQHAELLDFIVVQVDGVRKVVPSGQEISVIYGSKLLVEDAVLRKPGVRVDRVNIIGFTHSGWPSDEDRARPVDTAMDLKLNWSEKGEGLVYAIAAVSKDTLHGNVYFRLIRPELRYAEVLVNGKKHVMRDGGFLNLKATDKIQVLKVETNLDSAADVVFQVLKTADEKHIIDLGESSLRATHEIRFRRGQYVFARIPMKVTE